MSRQGVLLYIAGRIGALLALLVVLSFAVFSLLYVAPGSAVDMLLGTSPRTPETISALEEKYHLNEPFLVQYWIWVRDAAQLNFGTSVQTSLPVTDEIKARLPTSLYLGLYAFVLTMLFGIGLGIIAALRRRSILDRGIVSGSIFALCTPAFVSGIFLLYVFAIRVPLFPVSGTGVGIVDQLWHLTLPAVALALVGAAYVLKHTRVAVIGVLDQDYVLFARARGLSRPRVLWRYVLRNGLIPIVTISGVLLSFVITGAVIVEVTFSLGGIGGLLVQSANEKDLPMLQGVALVIAGVIMVANLLADLAYMAVDPRIRLGRRQS